MRYKEDMVHVVCAKGDVFLVAELFRLLGASWSRASGGKKARITVSFGESDLIRKGIPKVQYDRYRSSFSTMDSVMSEVTVIRLRFGSTIIPIYCGVRKINGSGKVLATTENGFVVARFVKEGSLLSVIFGYDILAELQFLLTIGQPIEYAAIPTLDLHINLLKLALSHISKDISNIKSGTPQKLLVLTHDVDIPFLRPHLFDTVFAGILARGISNLPGKTNLARLRRKTLLLSIEHAVGLTPDPLQGLANCLSIEETLKVKSTFFLVSRLGTAGRPCLRYEGYSRWRSMRKIKYGRQGLRRILNQLKDTGNEIALHGIDAWIFSGEAIQEKCALEKYGFKVYGNRMHWLYWGIDTPQVLADAGFTYDSSLGYNTSVGFRCGTAKPFRFPNAPTLWELPMIVMDNALLKRRDLSPEEMIEQVIPIVQQISKHGGILTLNWHIRSFGYERGCAKHYEKLVRYLQTLGFKCMQPVDIIEMELRTNEER